MDIGKRCEGKKPVTTACLTSEGRTMIEAYWDAMTEITRRSREMFETDTEETIEESVVPAGMPPQTSVPAHEGRCQRTTYEPKGSNT